MDEVQPVSPVEPPVEYSRKRKREDDNSQTSTKQT